MSDKQHIRHVEVTGLTNLRNFGGYPSKDGRSTKWGVLYRGDQLTQVPAEEAAAVLTGTLHIHHTIDFRGAREVQACPYNVTGIERHSFAVETTGFAEHIKAKKPFSPEITMDLLKTTYRQFVKDFAKTFGDAIKEIISIHPTADNAAMIHCTAGKDRTGIASYLVLRLCDVEREHIIRDYLLTNEYYKIPSFAKSYMEGLNLDDESMKIFWTVNTAFLEAAEKEIEELGGLDRYTKEYLQITEEEIKQLKNIMLE